MSGFHSFSVAQDIISESRTDQTLLEKQKLRAYLAEKFKDSSPTKSTIKKVARAILKDRKKGINRFSGEDGATNLAIFLDEKFSLEPSGSAFFEDEEEESSSFLEEG